MPTFAFLCTGIIKNFFNFNGREIFTSSCVYVSVWVQHSDFYKIIKDSHCGFEADSNQNNHLSGRHVADESDYKRSRNSQGYFDFFIAKSKLCNKSAEICSGALAKDRVSMSGNRLSENHITTGKSKKIETEMPKLISNPRTTLWEVTNLLVSLC